MSKGDRKEAIFLEHEVRIHDRRIQNTQVIWISLMARLEGSEATSRQPCVWKKAPKI